MEVKVTQADREVASKVLSSAITKEVLSGEFDGREIVRQFARHRISSQAELIEALEWALSEVHGRARYNRERQFGDCLRRANEALAKAKGEV